MKLDYFGQSIDPRLFGRGFGILSFCIRIVNALRIWSYRCLCLLILRAQLRQSAFNKDQKKEIYKRAKENFGVDLRTILPVKTKAETFRETNTSTAPPRTREERARARYGDKRVNSASTLTGPRPLDATEISSIFDQVFASQSRSSRYLRKRGQGEGLLVEAEAYQDE